MLNAVSPGLTYSLPFGSYLAEMCEQLGGAGPASSAPGSPLPGLCSLLVVAVSLLVVVVDAVVIVVFEHSGRP